MVGARRKRNARAGTRRAASAESLEPTCCVARHRRAGLTDANLARNERLAAESEAIDAQTALLGAEARLRALTGAAAPAVLAAESATAANPALDRHPRVLAAAAAAEVARAALRVAARSAREAPTVAVRVERDRGAAAEPFASAIGLRGTIPFPAGPQWRQRTAEAIAAASRAEAELAFARAEVAGEVDRARAALEAADRQLDAAQRRRELTADNLQLIEKAFALGEADLTTLLRVRAAALDAEAWPASALPATKPCRDFARRWELP